MSLLQSPASLVGILDDLCQCDLHVREAGVDIGSLGQRDRSGVGLDPRSVGAVSLQVVQEPAGEFVVLVGCGSGWRVG